MSLIIENRIFLIRGNKVMFDTDIAELYGVSTKVLNQAVKRNLSRFPADFMFRLTKEEVSAMNWSQIVTSSQKHRRQNNMPYVFTEHGIMMLSSVLGSEQAIAMSIFIVRAFVKIRELLATNKELAKRIEEIETKQKEFAEQLFNVYSVVKQFIEEPAVRRKKIGYKLD